jgi:hypothetical protein
MTIRPEVRGKEEEKISGQERYESDLRKRESKRRRIDRGLREASKERRCMHGSQLSCPFAAPSGPLMGQFRRLKSFTRTDSRKKKGIKTEGGYTAQRPFIHKKSCKKPASCFTGADCPLIPWSCEKKR